MSSEPADRNAPSPAEVDRPDLEPGETFRDIDDFPFPESKRLTKIDVSPHRRAGFWLRACAFLIDIAVLNLFSLLLLGAGVVALRLGLFLRGLEMSTADATHLLPFYQSALFTMGAAYFTLLHAGNGQTLGKALLGVQVVTVQGEPLSYGRAFLRWVAYFLSGFFFLGFLWIGVSREKRGWHDILAGTMVIKEGTR